MTSQRGRSVVQVIVLRVDIVVVTYEAMPSKCWRSVVQVLVVRVNIGVVIFEALTPQCGRSVGSGPSSQSGYSIGDIRSYDTKAWEVGCSGSGCQRNIGAVIYEAMTPQCMRRVVQVLVVRVDIRLVTYEAMTSQCGSSVVQVLVVRVDIEVVIYEAMSL